MAADLGFVAHAAQGDTRELAFDGLGDRARERGLADARRTDEAEDGAFELLRERLDGQVLDDAILDLLEAVVVAVQDLARVREVQVILRRGFPGHAHDPVQVETDDRRFGRHGGHHLELAHLGIGFFAGIVGKPGRFDLLLELGDLRLEFVAFAELLLDRGHLLVQVVLFLAAFHLLADARTDAALDLQDFDLALDKAEKAFHALERIGELQELLLFFELEIQMRDHRVGESRS